MASYHYFSECTWTDSLFHFWKEKYIVSILDVKHLSKTFDNNTVVDDVSFSLSSGQCIALLGPNGAGKTTILKMLAGLLTPTRGSIQFQQVGAGEDRRQYIGYLPQYPSFYEWMSGKEFLEYVGKLAYLSSKEASARAAELLDKVGLMEAQNQRISKYSGGMKQRLGIAQAMIHRPRLLMLDEPVSALDPFGRREVLEMITQLKKETTILFSSHILNDAEEISDEVIIIHRGQLMESGPLHALKQQYKQAVITIETIGEAEEWLASWADWDIVTHIQIKGHQARVTLNDFESGKQLLLQKIVEQNIPVQKYEVGKVTLEDLFMRVVES